MASMMTTPPIGTNASPTHNRTRKRQMTFLGIALLVVISLVLLGAGGMLLTVDDWSRDLQLNVAEISETALDADLHPVHFILPPQEAADCVERELAKLPHWRLASRTPLENGIELKWERKTRWLGFIDDVTVRLTVVEDGSVLSAQSRSRVGKGDLGQNPRNLRELIRAVRDCVSHAPSVF